MSLLILLQTQGTAPTPQSVDGTLSLAGGVTMQVLTPISLTATLTMAGVVTSALRAMKALAGTLTSSATLDSTYVPPSGGDLLTTLFRRNQTD